jgi:transcriptional regulator with PAS, ATPase and Fis domain
MLRDILKPPLAPPLESLHGIYTAAPERASVFRLIDRVARTDCTVLVRGETGSGK